MVRVSDAATGEKSEKVAQGATSTSPNWGKHRLAHKDGLRRDVLLHRTIFGKQDDSSNAIL
jgi:hypothetical protein